jgi:hypothetical protein
MIHTITMSRRPLYKGYDPDGIHTATANFVETAPFNYTQNTPHLLISSCFVGERGSYRWKFNMFMDAESDRLSASRSSEPLIVGGYVGSAFILTGGYSQRCASLITMNTNSGSSVTNSRTQTGLEIEAPMYNNVTMLNTAPIDRTLGEPADNTETDSIQFQVSIPSYNADAGASNTVQMTRYYCIGTDYSTVFFLNCPTLYYYANPFPA